jgi:uncharacterized membrane protein (GlpM family)
MAGTGEATLRSPGHARVGMAIAETIAWATVVLLILVAQRQGDSAMAAAAATVPIGTLIGLITFAGGDDPAGAQAFTRSAVLALPVWGAFAVSTFLLTRVLDWRLAVVAGLLIWLGATVLYLRLHR